MIANKRKLENVDKELGEISKKKSHAKFSKGETYGKPGFSFREHAKYFAAYEIFKDI